LDDSAESPVWNRIVTLKDGWAKAQRRGAGRPDRSSQDNPAKPKPASPEPGGTPATRSAADPDPLAELSAEARAKADTWLQAGVQPADASVLAKEPLLARFFGEAQAAGAEASGAAAWTVQELRPLLRTHGSLPEGLG